jgi:hypothetical protein
MVRRRKDGPRPDDNPMAALRLQALHTNASDFGMEPSESFPNVFGVVMDMAYPNGVATLVCFADGTTSLHTSTGSGIIGGGAHPQVVRAGRELLRVAEDLRSCCVADPTDEPPLPGAVTIRLLTFDGRVAVTEQEVVLGEGHSPLSPLFHAAHAVLSELRQIDERSGQRRPDRLRAAALFVAPGFAVLAAFATVFVAFLVAAAAFFSAFSTARPLFTTALATNRPVALAALRVVVFAAGAVVSITGAAAAAKRNATIAFSAAARRL